MAELLSMNHAAVLQINNNSEMRDIGIWVDIT